MIPEFIDRRRLKADARTLLSNAEVCPKRMTALYMALNVAISLVVSLVQTEGLFSTFISIFSSLLSMMLSAGFVLYCMAIRRGERAEYLTLFDGFDFAGKLIALNIIMFGLIALWSMLFVVPGIIAAYRYRFAPYNLYEDPELSPLEALRMSRQQTLGYKGQLLTLDLSYLGWIFLAGIPSYIESFFLYQEMASVLTGIPTVTNGFSLYSVIPAWCWTLIIGVWGLAVAMFYLPNMQCVDLEYFEIAKRTSGVGPRPALAESNLWDNEQDNF